MLSILAAEHEAMRQRLAELEEVTGEKGHALRWTASGTELAETQDREQIRLFGIGAEMVRATLDDVCEIVGYKPDHDKEFSGDRLIEIIK